MSYALSASLQAAIYGRLTADAGLSAMVGSNIFDALPPGPLPPTYVTLGPEEAKDASDGTGHGAIHELEIAVVTEVAGFQAAKDAAAIICDALIDTDLSLARGQLISLMFLKARAARSGTTRRIDLTFRARVEDA